MIVLQFSANRSFGSRAIVGYTRLLGHTAGSAEVEFSHVDFGFEQYERMAELARTVQGAVVISINDHPDIRRVFAGLHLEELGIAYTVGGGAGTPARELLIWNDHCEERRRETGTLRLF